MIRNVYIQCIKILAIGSYKRFMWLCIDGVVSCYRISYDTYDLLKSIGVPTCQSLRKYK